MTVSNDIPSPTLLAVCWEGSDEGRCDLETSGRHHLEKSQRRSKFILKVKSSPGGSLGPKLGYKNQAAQIHQKGTEAQPTLLDLECLNHGCQLPGMKRSVYLRCGCHLLTVTNNDV